MLHSLRRQGQQRTEAAPYGGRVKRGGTGTGPKHQVGEQMSSHVGERRQQAS